MAEFVPRLSAEGIYQHNYWYSDNPFYQSGYGLPNCTCYAWGRFYEISGSRPSNLSTGDAGDWFEFNQAGGWYEYGSTPRLGAIICYSQSGAAGHVAVVEQINSDGSFVISQSSYYRPIADYPPDTEDYFWTETCDGTTKKSSWMTNLVFQGFIYCPGITDSVSPTDWISKNAYLTQSEMENNARMVWNYFGSRGWSLNAVSAMLGNMETESTINPGIWESLESDYDAYFDAHGRYPGYGLVQWTPFTKYSEWAGAGWQDNGNKECERILYEVDKGEQWFQNPNAPIVNPPITFKEFTTSLLDVEILANYFLWYYEHPAVTEQPARGEQAIKWYNFLYGTTPTPPDIPAVGKTGRNVKMNSKWAVALQMRRRLAIWL